MKIIELTKNFLCTSGWKQVTLAQAVGLHPTTLNRYLHGKIKPGTGEILANFLLSSSNALTATPTTPPEGEGGVGEPETAQEGRDA